MSFRGCLFFSFESSSSPPPPVFIRELLASQSIKKRPPTLVCVYTQLSIGGGLVCFHRCKSFSRHHRRNGGGKTTTTTTFVINIQKLGSRGQRTPYTSFKTRFKRPPTVSRVPAVNKKTLASSWCRSQKLYGNRPSGSYVPTHTHART